MSTRTCYPSSSRISTFHTTMQEPCQSPEVAVSTLHWHEKVLYGDSHWDTQMSTVAIIFIGHYAFICVIMDRNSVDAILQWRKWSPLIGMTGRCSRHKFSAKLGWHISCKAGLRTAGGTSKVHGEHNLGLLVKTERN